MRVVDVRVVVRTGVAVGLAAAMAFAVAGTATADTAVSAPCIGASTAPQPLSVTVGTQTATGLYSLPTTAPRGIVVVGHGFPGTASTFASQMQQIATADGVIALSMNYRGTDLSTGQGWRVLEGAQDSIAATKLFDAACGGANFVNSVFGISMGGNMSGLAVSQNAKRSTGAPLYNYWFDVSGVSDVTETWADAEVISQVPLGSVQTTGKNALAALSAEFGGTPLTVPGTYLADSPVTRAGLMRASGIQGVEVFHGVDDGEVTADQGAQMAAALVLAGVPTNVYTSVFNYPGGDNGLTLDGDTLGAAYAAVNTAVLMGMLPPYVSPFSGHVSAVVMATALAHLQALYTQHQVPTGIAVTLQDGVLGTYPFLAAPNPLAGLPNLTVGLSGLFGKL
jgi:acetyl esterase/lipase